ncbi:Intraflagellar transport protein [Cinnamomum micranthum f. kanehirae]|uniref:Intraflagellar transport protein n=1 Tax=Cinnamomum micranthum f. kanehirae TaxID=337451 RepID=A0A443PH15_9MAGN|nr:Intraflagellar transport protein [Cinnamomum micranthum f. kanehirae]
MGPINRINGRDGSSSSAWSVFDTIKDFPPTPEALMAEIDSAISISEYNHSTSLLHNAFTQQQQHRYDARLADQGYKSGCAELAAGNVDEALRHLQTSLSLCPPDKTSAVTKLRSLISFVSQQKNQKPPTT